MSVKVLIPTPLRGLTGGAGQVESDGSTILELIDKLEASYPGIKDRLCDDSGQLRRFINIYVEKEDVRFQKGLSTELKDGAEVSILPAIAGG
ncbi:MAG: MoaD/ThiS family protein [Rubrobacteridae bacterium]|nr:MoaD/ThiS family protein [Rubrobacteridae bacterium]